MHAYCLFCETQSCGQIATIIKKDFGFQCMYPAGVLCHSGAGVSVSIYGTAIADAAQSYRYNSMPGEW